VRGIHVKLLAIVLISVGLLLCWFKATRLGLPLVPTEKADVWTVEAKIGFKARKASPVKIRFYIPRQPAGYTVVDENFVSGSYGLTTEDDGVHRVAEWAIREIQGYQVLYYRLYLSRDTTVSNITTSTQSIPAPVPRFVQLPEALDSAAKGLMAEVRNKSADNKTFVRELLVQLNSPTANPNIILLRQGIENKEQWVKRIIDLLASANVTARLAHILILKDGLKHGVLSPWLEVFDGKQWLALDPEKGEPGMPEESIVWHVGDDQILSLDGGNSAKVEYSVTERVQDRTLVAEHRARQMGSRLMEYSLFSLPVSVQNVYRVLLMVPIGAFLIVILRNIIGLKTFGTFMPILIAMAFRETELLWGMALFSLLVTLGLLIRFYLEYLKLLLVPRLASVLIIVIILMAIISIFSHKLGFDRGLSVALFPMVILAMTIERMSLVWEELGAAEAMAQGVGSLIVAAISFICMSNPYLEHLIFVFPELLLVILAFTLLLGRYTGYRLTELWRFRSALRG